MSVPGGAVKRVAGQWSVLVIAVLLCGLTCGQQRHYVNVALGKPCTMSSSFSGRYGNLTPRDTQLAVDGDQSTEDVRCAHTDNNDFNCSWEVDLGQPYSIHRMVSFARDTFEHRMRGIVVTVDGNHCFTYPQYFSQSGGYGFTCDSGVRTGRRVRLSKVSPLNTLGGDYTINLCEFQVFTCGDGYWGTDCTMPCGNCGTDAPVCDKVTGDCTQSCKPGWKVQAHPSNLCTEACDAYTWGDGCRSNCSEHCSDVCDRVTGHCTCKPGYLPPDCTAECAVGTYGQNCLAPCGQGCVGGTCDHVTGQCSCQPGWQPSLCQTECGAGTYGIDCKSQCGRCEGGASCHHVTGNCSQCQTFFDMPLCVNCVDYKYGPDCSKTCSDHCAYLCDKELGHCTCNPGWQQPVCVQECDGGTYGFHCQSRCGNCSTGSASCDRVNGSCPTGCQRGLEPPLCQMALQGGSGGDDGGGGNTGMIVGVVVGVVVIAAVVLIVIVIIRRRGGGLLPSTRSRKQEARESSPSFPNDPSSDNNGNNNGRKKGKRGKKELSSAYSRENIYQNVSLDRNEAGATAESDQRHSNNAAKPVVPLKPKLKTTATTTTTTAVTASAAGPSGGDGTAGDIYQNTTSWNNTPLPPSSPNSSSPSSTPSLPPPLQLPPSHHQQQKQQPPTAAHDVGEVDDADDDVNRLSDVYYNDDTYMTSEEARLGLDPIQRHLLERLRAKDLDKEFQKLETGMTRAHTVGDAEENYYRNRFKSILPYDDNRVILKDPPHAGANDYINASFIRGWNSDKAYIASQGPKTNTMADMWWMVWQQDVSHIVMLTNLVEADRRKCDEYWPARGTERTYGSLCVRGLQCHKRADYVIRTFDVKQAKGGPRRRVTQFHFVTWPDHDVPSVTSLVDFWSSVSWSLRHRGPPRAPLLVHCSAGVGRTGAFLALDWAMQQLQQTQHSKSSNVQQTAASLRHDRCHMIQTKAQYRLVHEAILQAYTCRHCRAPVTSLTSDLAGTATSQGPNSAALSNDVIDTQFQKLQQMKVLLTKPSHSMAEEEENINKNRDITVLPDDNHLMYLTHYIKGRNQYINAVCTPTFFKSRGCIMTQLPLQDTVIDFWRLVAGNDVTTVVSLGKMDRGDIYWPEKSGHSQTHGPFTVVLKAVTSLGPLLTSYHLSLASEGATHSDLRLLHYSAWSDALPATDDVTDLLQLACVITEQETAAAADDKAAPIVLQCRDGGTRSGIFRVIVDVIHRMTSDGQIDVYTAVKHIQNVHQRCVTTVEEYRFVHWILRRYQESNSVYQNT